MQRVAVFSDIHANAEALAAVVEDIARRDIDEMWCLGDVIGNGHDPVHCFDTVEERCSVTLAGNHEVVISSSRTDIPPAAAYSRSALHQAGNGRLEGLVGRSSETRKRGVCMAHGCPYPFDAVRDYVCEDVDPHEVLSACPDDALILVGHTHVPGEWSEGARRLINVGSVGEPRDGTRLPTWTELVWIEQGDVEVVRHHVAFDVDRYRSNMAAAGLQLPPMWEA